MPQERFDIYFAGELLPDHPADAAKRWVGTQFKLQGEALERLFSGQPVRIKQDVDMDTAGRYRSAFRQVGALLQIRPVEAAMPAGGPETGDTGGEPELLPANTGSLEDCAITAPAAPLPDIAHLLLDTVGHPLDERAPAPPPDIDTGDLSAAPPNTGDLSDCVQVKPARPIPDISQLQLADD